MTPIVNTLEIARPPAEVFAYVTDPARFHEWQRDVVRVRMAEGRQPGAGVRFTTTRQFGGVEHTSTQEITEFGPPSRFFARGVDGPVRADAGITVEPLDGGTRSLVTFELDFHGQGMGRLLVPNVLRGMASKQAPKSYRNVKELLERT